MPRSFLVSLTDLNLERLQHRDWKQLFRDPDWRKSALMERLHGFLDRLPALERDVIDLYFGLHPGGQPKKQETIAGLLGISQQAVSHRMYNAFKRISFMMAQPEVDPVQMRKDLASMLKNPFTVNVLCDFATTSSQTATARTLGVSQQRVCWHLNSAVKLLKQDGNIEALFYVDYFENLMRHRNILREVLAGRRRKEEDTRELGRTGEEGPSTSSGDFGSSYYITPDEGSRALACSASSDSGTTAGNPEA